MSYWPDRASIVTTFYSLIVGGIGAALAYWLSFPVFMLTGPAIIISALSFAGIRFAIADIVRDVAFLFLGISIGAGVNAEATAALARWPLAFLALIVMLLITLTGCRFLLTRYFDFDRRSALLASTPGHFSFVVSIGSSLDLNVAKIAAVQSVRLLALTILVPFVAVAFGVNIAASILPSGVAMQSIHVAILLAASLGFGLALKRFKVPAPLLIGGLIISAFSHAMDITPGVLSAAITLPCFLIVGTMIGTRFSGIAVLQLKQALMAGLIITVVSVGAAIIAAVSVAAFVGMPAAHVVVAFAPGGLETMVAMGVMLGANPGFVAACHVGRLLCLTVLVPFFIGRNAKAKTGSDIAE